LADTISKVGGFNALVTTLVCTVFGSLIRKDWIRNLTKKIRREMINEARHRDIPSR
jgi:hypothetical protein